MKKIIVIFCLLFSISFKAQDKAVKNDNEDYDLFISGGCHFGLWAAIEGQEINSKQLPYNIHIDKLFKEKYALGLGYSFDVYSTNSTFLPYSPTKSNYRHNFRIRYYKYLRDQDQFFSIYIGTSAGISYWDVPDNGYSLLATQRYWPTAQFLTGIKLKINQAFFWLTEFGIGPPYMLQSSLGIKF